MIIFHSPSLFNDDFFSFVLPKPYRLLDSSPKKQLNTKKRSVYDDVNQNETSNKLRVVDSRLRYEMNDLDDHYNVSIDVPGIKLADIELEIVEDRKVQIHAKRKRNENTVKKYEQTFVFDNKKVDLKNVKAELENGLLNVKIGKKKPDEPFTIDVTNERPSEISENGNKQEHDEVLLTLDLPGVKIDDINVKLHEESIHVDAKRHRGNSSFMIRKVVAVDDKNYDMKHMRADFIDGVLTVMAPHIEISDKDSSGLITSRKTIHISSEEKTKQNDEESEDSSNNKVETQKE